VREWLWNIQTWIKKFGIFGGEFRNRTKRYDVTTDIVSGLVNFRILSSLNI